jgi:hypothetical protein
MRPTIWWAKFSFGPMMDRTIRGVIGLLPNFKDVDSSLKRQIESPSTRSCTLDGRTFG